MTATIDTPAAVTESERLLADAFGFRCTLCETPWPGEPLPLMHRWVIDTTRPCMVCDCDGTHNEPVWHRFTVENQHGELLADGMVCPTCIVDHGLDRATSHACIEAMPTSEH